LGLAIEMVKLDEVLAGIARCSLGASIAFRHSHFQEPWPDQSEPAASDRQAAGEAWATLRSCDFKERYFLIERAPEFRTWALAERLCSESEAATADDADRSIELAKLAVHVATLA